jgi:hypothetical protein
MQKETRKKKRSLRNILSAALTLAAIFTFPAAVGAQLTDAVDAVQKTTAAAGVAGGGDLVQIIGRIINIFLGFLGVIFLVLMLYAGYTWMTAGGAPVKIESAKKTIRNAVIGLLIITSAWAITAFILNALTEATGGGGVTGGGPGGIGLVGSSGSLGAGIIEYHLPERNATDVPRNTPVIITFKEAIQPASFIEGWTESTSGTVNGLNSANVQLYRSDDPKTALASSAARVSFTQDRKTFVIRPVDLLGSPTNNVKYSVKLRGGNSGIMLEKGGPAFGGSYGQGYEWMFEVSTFVDTTPPQVLAAIPYAGGKYARNIVIQVTFNEAVDPTGATGLFQNGSGFTNMSVRPNGGLGTPLDGEYRISNKYKTVEFLTTDKCGVNSCGKDVFCLPPDATLEVLVKAATLSSQPPMAQFTNQGFDGITDVVGNSLDGNANKTAEGSPQDNYVWTFGTSNEVKLAPPKILETVPDASPGQGQSNRPLDEPVSAIFDTLLQSSTLNSEAARIEPLGPAETNPDTFWYSVSMELLTANNTPIKQNEVADRAAVIIKHRPYQPSGLKPTELNYYNPFLLSDIQDAFQNCFNPATSAVCKGAPNCCNNAPKGQDCSFKP